MSNKIQSHGFTQILLKQAYVDHIMELKIKYALALVKSEGIKSIIFLFFFYMIGQFHAFLLCFAMLSTLRAFSGGFHMKSNLACFHISFFYLLGIICVLPKISIPNNVSIAAMGFCVLVICILSPIPSFKRPIRSKAKFRRCKILSILFSISWTIIILLLIDTTSLKYCGMWVIVLQAVQLIGQSLFRKFARKAM